MAEAKNTIIAEIEVFKKDHGADYDEYYIGITNDLDRRLNEMNEHMRNGIYTNGQPYYSEECESREDAVEIELYFQNKGMERLNKSAHGVTTSKFIYCFKMTGENIRVLHEKRSVRQPFKLMNLDEFKKYNS